MFTGLVKILVVGDEDGRLESIQRVLDHSDLGTYDLDAVLTSDTIAKNCWSNRYDVCIIDSIANAMDLISEARGVGFTPPIIILTSDEAAEVLEAIRAGALDCLVREELTAAQLEESICSVIARSRRLEEQERHEQCFLALVEHASEIIYTLDLKGDCTFINKAGEELTGYAQEEVLGLNFSQLFTAKCALGIWRTILRMLNDHRPATFDAIMVKKSGQQLTVSLTAHLLYKDGIPIGVQSIAQAEEFGTASTPEDGWEKYYEGVCEG
jgi:PAS domain S-box-containing protein